MTGIMFAISMFSTLVLAGILFVWMVRLASMSHFQRQK